MSQKTGSKWNDAENYASQSDNTNRTGRTKISIERRSTKKDFQKKNQIQKEKENEAQRKKDTKESARNVVIFTGRALVEILRDQTMQKSFMTLAYISDMMIGSEISPL